VAHLPAPHLIDAVIFDVGGVLLLPDPQAGRQAISGLGYAPSDDEWRRAHYTANLVLDTQDGRPDWAGARRAFAAALGVLDHHVEVVVPLLEKLVVSTPYIPVADATQTLRILAGAGYKLGIVSNAFGTVAQDLEAQGICSTTANEMPQVGIVVDSHLVGIEKPDPRIFHVALSALEVEASQAVYVGNTVKFDVNGAIAAGLHPIHMDPYGFCVGDHSHIAALSDLVDWLDFRAHPEFNAQDPVHLPS
jgi:putative hydrolase of the HAD superfamily